MVGLSKKFALILIFVLAMSGLFLGEFCVASVAKPATPEFTIQEIAQPYDAPPTTITTVDPILAKKQQQPTQGTL